MRKGLPSTGGPIQSNNHSPNFFAKNFPIHLLSIIVIRRRVLIRRGNILRPGSLQGVLRSADLLRLYCSEPTAASLHSSRGLDRNSVTEANWMEGR